MGTITAIRHHRARKQFQKPDTFSNMLLWTTRLVYGLFAFLFCSMLGALLELDAPSHHGEFTAVAVLNREKNIPPVETIAFCVVISSCESF